MRGFPCRTMTCGLRTEAIVKIVGEHVCRNLCRSALVRKVKALCMGFTPIHSAKSLDLYTRNCTPTFVYSPLVKNHKMRYTRWVRRGLCHSVWCLGTCAVRPVFPHRRMPYNLLFSPLLYRILQDLANIFSKDYCKSLAYRTLNVKGCRKYGLCFREGKKRML